MWNFVQGHRTGERRILQLFNKHLWGICSIQSKEQVGAEVLIQEVNHGSYH